MRHKLALLRVSHSKAKSEPSWVTRLGGDELDFHLRTQLPRNMVDEADTRSLEVHIFLVDSLEYF